MTKRISEEYFPMFRSLGSTVQVPAGELILMQGEAAERIYLVLQGRVRIFLNTPGGEEFTLEIAKKGGIFGDTSFIRKSLQHVSIQAVTDVEIASCRPQDLIPALQENRGLLEQVLQILTGNCNDLFHSLTRVLHYTSLQKVADYLLEHTGGASSSIPYTHSDLACCLGMNRVTASRQLEALKDQGLVDYGYGQIRVLDRAGLAALLPAEA